MPSISPASRAWTSAASWASNRAFGGLGRIHHPQVHRREPVDAEGGEVVLDALAQLVRRVEAQQRTGGVAVGGDLAHDPEGVGIGVQRLVSCA